MNSFQKQILLSLLFLFFLNLSFFGLYLIFYSKAITFLSSLIIFLIIFSLLNSIFVFFSLSFLEQIIWHKRKIKERLIVFGIISLSSFPIFFWFGFNVYSLLSFVLFSLLLFLSCQSAKKEQSKYLKFSFSKTFKTCKFSFLTAFAFLIAFVGFLSPKLLGGKVEISHSLYDLFFPEIEEKLSSQYPGFSGEMMFDEFILLIYLKNPPKNSPIKKAKEEIKTYSDFKKFSKELQKNVNKKEMDKFLAQGRKEVKRSFGLDELGIEIRGEEKMKEVFYKLFSNWLSMRKNFYQRLGIITGLILFFFFVARFTLALVGIFSFSLAWILFKILRKINFFKIATEKIDREKITI